MIGIGLTSGIKILKKRGLVKPREPRFRGHLKQFNIRAKNHDPDKAFRSSLRAIRRAAMLPLKKRKIRLRSYLWKWLKHGLNPVLMPQIVGCPREEFRRYIEARFTHRMSWGNYGPYWQIDHIIPCSKFDLTQEKDVLVCFHFSNLQPLRKLDNLRKSAKVTNPQIFLRI